MAGTDVPASKTDPLTVFGRWGMILLIFRGTGELTMLRCSGFLTLYCAVLLLTILCPQPVADAADKKDDKDNKVAGILIDKKDDELTVKADGEEEPVKYKVGKDDKKLVEALKGIFNASRVQLTFKKDGDSRQLLTIKKQVLKESGTFTGVVVKVYNDFWVEVKPKEGSPDAFAPSVTNYKDKDFMEKLKGLKAGTTVTITYTTDFERHRIQTLKIKEEKDK